MLHAKLICAFPLAVLILLIGACDSAPGELEEAVAADSEEAYADIVVRNPDHEVAVQAQEKLTNVLEERIAKAREGCRGFWKENNVLLALMPADIPPEGEPARYVEQSGRLGSLTADGKFVPDPRATDPWGNPYALEIRWRSATAVSSGPDGKRGTDDDVREPPPAAFDVEPWTGSGDPILFINRRFSKESWDSPPADDAPNVATPRMKKMIVVDGLASRLEELGDVDRLTVDLRGCSFLTSVDGLRSAIPTVLALGFEDSDGLRDLTGLAGLAHLRDLNLSSCESITSLEGVKDLPALRTLWVRNCYGLESLAGLDNLPVLETLVLEGCTLESLAGLNNLPVLETLVLEGCTSLESLAGIEALPSLRSLDLGATQIQDFGPLASLPALVELDISSRYLDASSLNGVDVSLESLKVSGFGPEPFQDIAKLDRLSIEIPSVLGDESSALPPLPEVRSLEVTWGSLRSLSELANHQGLESLVLSSKHLRTIDDLSKLSSLRELRLDGCESIEDLEPLSGLPLERLELIRNRADLTPLWDITTLKSLSITWGGSIGNLEGIERLVALEELDVSVSKVEGDGVARLQALEARGVRVTR